MEGDMEDNMDGDMMKSPLMSNLIYLTVAMNGALWGWLAMTRYTVEDYYVYGNFNGTNLHKLSSMAKSWFSTIVWTVLSITQILSMFGILGEINIMLWVYSMMPMVAMSLIVELVRMYIYDSAYTIINADPQTTDTFEATADNGDTGNISVVIGATATGAYIQGEMALDTIMESAQFFALANAYMGWSYAQVMLLPEEFWMDEEMMEEEMFSLFRF